MDSFACYLTCSDISLEKSFSEVCKFVQNLFHYYHFISELLYLGVTPIGRKKTVWDWSFNLIETVVFILLVILSIISVKGIWMDYKEEKINSLTKEIEELNAGGASEEEVTILKRQKQDLENRLKDQEEELDDLAGQVQMLEAAKTKLEMSMAAIKKEHR